MLTLPVTLKRSVRRLPLSDIVYSPTNPRTKEPRIPAYLESIRHINCSQMVEFCVPFPSGGYDLKTPHAMYIRTPPGICELPQCRAMRSKSCYTDKVV